MGLRLPDVSHIGLNPDMFAKFHKNRFKIDWEINKKHALQVQVHIYKYEWSQSWSIYEFTWYENQLWLVRVFQRLRNGNWPDSTDTVRKIKLRPAQSNWSRATSLCSTPLRHNPTRPNKSVCLTCLVVLRHKVYVGLQGICRASRCMSGFTVLFYDIVGPLWHSSFKETKSLFFRKNSILWGASVTVR